MGMIDRGPEIGRQGRRAGMPPSGPFGARSSSMGDLWWTCRTPRRVVGMGRRRACSAGRRTLLELRIVQRRRNVVYTGYLSVL